MHNQADDHVLPDLLAPDLPLWFVGTAAGPKSAAVGAYYAHRGNRFWRALHEVGLTPRQLEPHEFPALLELRIGLTDICKTASGVDSQLPKDKFDVAGFQAKVDELKPRALAFTSKAAASHWLKRQTGAIKIGRQPNVTGLRGPTIFVLPSPSGLATSYWSIAPWYELAEWFKR